MTQTARPVLVVNRLIGALFVTAGAFGLLMALILGVMAVTDLHTPPAVVPVLILFTVLSVSLLRRGVARRRQALLFRRYAVILSQDPEHSLGNLAAALGEPLETVRKNMRSMLQRRYFLGAHLAGDTLVLPGEAAQAPSQAPAAVVMCAGCGATNRGGFGECEYCGSPLGS